MKQFLELENKMVRYSDLVKIITKESGEPFVALKKDVIKNGYLPEMADMKKVIGDRIMVRKTVYRKLLNAQEYLSKIRPGLSLYITYGYRSLEIQTARFLKRIREISKDVFFENASDLYEETHRYVAVPTVSGHPTGGAIDILIQEKNTGRFIDFGTKMYDYTTKNCYVFSPNISNSAKKNRNLLRDVMKKVGFAPFDGEWWHFSYGDREWAFYYKKRQAIYDQVSVKSFRQSTFFRDPEVGAGGIPS